MDVELMEERRKNQVSLMLHMATDLNALALIQPEDIFGNVEAYLKSCDPWVGTYGVETITDRGPEIIYCNSGDPYKVTLLFDAADQQFKVAGYGDIIEQRGLMVDNIMCPDSWSLGTKCENEATASVWMRHPVTPEQRGPQYYCPEHASSVVRRLPSAYADHDPFTPEAIKRQQRDAYLEGRREIGGRRLRFEAGLDICLSTLEILQEYAADCESEWFQAEHDKTLPLVKAAIAWADRIQNGEDEETEPNDLIAWVRWLTQVAEILPRLWD